MDLIDPFLTFAEHNPDFNNGDHLAETMRLIERQAVIEDWLCGQTDVDHVLDTLSDQRINPDHYVEGVCHAVNAAIDGEMVFASNDSGLFLPVI